MKRSTLGVVTACALAAAIGFWSGSRPSAASASMEDESAIAKAGTNGTGSHDEDGTASDPKKRPPEQLAGLKKDLIRRFSSCPSPANDWALREQAAAVLGSMSQQELAAFARELSPPGGGFDAMPEWQHALLHSVFRQWGLKDPVNASLGLAEMPWTFTSRAAAFNDWLQREPEAAKTWITGGPFPPGSEKALAALQQDFLNHQMASDFSAALDSLGKLDAMLRKRMLLSWSIKLALDPAKRDGLFELIASQDNPDFARQCYRQLVATMANKSLHDADAFVENSSLPEDEKDELHDMILGRWAAKDPQEAFPRWAELKKDSAPAPLLQAMDSWSQRSPGCEQAVDWVMKLDAGPAREQFKMHLIDRMSSGERFQQAAEMSDSLADPTERLRQMKTVKREWDQKFPDHAQAWFGKLPQADREALQKSIE